MSIRYRRNRVLIISVVTILVLFYYYYNRSDEAPDPTIAKDRQLVIDEVLKRNQKENLDPVTEKIPTTTTTVKRQARAVREEFVEIDGKKLRKIDWHDYDAIERENARTGPGEGGAGVEPSATERNSPEFQRLYRENGFNAFISNNISLDRSVKDIRHPR